MREALRPLVDRAGHGVVTGELGEAKGDDELARLGGSFNAMLAAVEMIEGGVTTVADHYFAMDQVAQAIATSGLRGELAWTMFGQGDGRSELDQAATFAE